jgi:hypothetical protein
MSVINKIHQFRRNLSFLFQNSLGGEFNRLDKRSDQLKKSVGCVLRSQCHDVDPWFLGAKDSCKGQRCFLLGCGPSLNAVDLTKLKGHKVMGVNGTALIEGLDLDYFVTVSDFFWKSHQDELKALKCQRFIPQFLREHLESESPSVWLNTIADKEYSALDVEKPWKFSYQPQRHIFLGGTVIFVCLQILYYLGYEEVVVLGLDHDYGIDKDSISKEGKVVSSDNLSAHFTKDYYKKGEQVHIDIHGMERAYELSRAAYFADGRRVLNASPGTKLDIFEKVQYDSLF